MNADSFVAAKQLERSWESNPVYMCVVNLEKAYDHDLWDIW